MSSSSLTHLTSSFPAGKFVFVFVFVFVFGERVETAVGSSGQLAPAELITPPLTRLLHCLLIQGTAIVSLPPSPTSRHCIVQCTVYNYAHPFKKKCNNVPAPPLTTPVTTLLENAAQSRNAPLALFYCT